MLLLEAYREIERIAERMLQAGRDDRWQDVRQHECSIRTVADHIKRTIGQPRLGAEMRRERVRILRRLLSIDADLRRIADPAVGRLDAMLGGMRASA